MYLEEAPAVSCNYERPRMIHGDYFLYVSCITLVCAAFLDAVSTISCIKAGKPLVRPRISPIFSLLSTSTRRILSEGFTILAAEIYVAYLFASKLYFARWLFGALFLFQVGFHLYFLDVNIKNMRDKT